MLIGTPKRGLIWNFFWFFSISFTKWLWKCLVPCEFLMFEILGHASANLAKRKECTNQFLKNGIFAFMTYCRFLPKSSSNIRFVVQDSRVWGLYGERRWCRWPWTLKSLMANLKFQPILGKYSNFEKNVYHFFSFGQIPTVLHISLLWP